MTCIFCKKGPQHGVTVFRLNPKGIKGVWACERHIKQTDATIPDDVKAITDILEAR